MLREGSVRKFVLHDGESACYQYVGDSADCCNHYHLKCSECGKLIHVECSFLDKVAERVHPQRGEYRALRSLRRVRRKEKE